MKALLRYVKALITWSDDDYDVEIDSDDEVAQLCFAGLEDSSSDNDEDEALVAENKSLLERISKLTEENQYLKNEIEMKDICLEALKKESIFVDPETVKRDSVPDPLVPKLKQKVAQLENDLAKCFHGEGTLNALLGKQKSSLDKCGLGCESIKKCAFQGDKSIFLSLVSKEGGLVTLGDSNTVRIIGKGTICNDMFAISNVRLVDGLKYNLISVSQLTDAGHKVKFDKDVCYIGTQSYGFALIAKRKGNIFVLDFDEEQEEICLATVQDQQNLWHWRLGHVHKDLLRKISSHDLVRGLPKLKFKKVEPFTACQLGKQVKTYFIAKNRVSTTDPLQLLHLDHFGLERTSKAYRVYNSVKNKVEESINITFNESSRNISQIDEDTADLSSHSKMRQSLSQKSQSHSEKSSSHDYRGSSQSSDNSTGFTQASDDSSGSPKTPDSVSNMIFITPLDNSSQAKMTLSDSNETTPIQFQEDNSNEEEMSNILLPKSSKIVKNHPPDNLLTDLDQGISTRSRLHNLYILCAFVAEFKPKNAQEAVANAHWYVAMQEELNQFEHCDVWELVQPPRDAKVIAHKKFKLYQMDVKSALLNGYFKEEVYRTPTDGASGSKRQRIGKSEFEASSATSESSFERHAKENVSKVISKLVLKERLCDLDLLKKLGVVELFESIGYHYKKFAIRQHLTNNG
ncbi:hypothetical protein AgCh_022893 [Apium graveolens]